MQRDLSLADALEVFYVEDHPTNVRLMQALFSRRPEYELVVAGDGKTARDVAGRLRPSLLLLDLRLPDCHGRDLLEELRRIDGWADIPAVAVTAEKGFQLEGSSFCEIWPKPLDLNFVLGRLDQLVAPAMTTPGAPRARAGVALHTLE